ncbi:hypothetical protein KSP40_PGU010964 [Platanthera guangdongensis]|uniref:Uncharacterized protein n=1 Tax=Platanthera guangdongensis TaxID=2320717 RepID=A0ABR2LGK3_9ASPA
MARIYCPSRVFLIGFGAHCLPVGRSPAIILEALRNELLGCGIGRENGARLSDWMRVDAVDE